MQKGITDLRISHLLSSLGKQVYPGLELVARLVEPQSFTIPPS